MKKDVIKGIIFAKSTKDMHQITVQIDTNTAILYCYRNYSSFRPAHALRAIEILATKLQEENIALHSKLLTNFDEFVAVGYSPLIFEKMFNNIFNYQFTYSYLWGDNGVFK